jgi:hypothetical protein
MNAKDLHKIASNANRASTEAVISVLATFKIRSHTYYTDHILPYLTQCATDGQFTAKISLPQQHGMCEKFDTAFRLYDETLNLLPDYFNCCDQSVNAIVELLKDIGYDVVVTKCMDVHTLTITW